jgi:hypothetical protein
VEETFFREIEMADWFKRKREKIGFFLSGVLPSYFFSICESQFVVHKPKVYKKNCKKIIQGGEDFQDGVCTFLLHENILFGISSSFKS